MTGPQRTYQLADYVHELTRPHENREHYQTQDDRNGTWYGHDHVVRVPSLIAQLQHATPSSSGDEQFNHEYGSKPAARLDAVDTATRIRRETTDWLHLLGVAPRSHDPADLILQLHGLQASADPDTRRAIAAAVRRWWIAARLAAGWDSPPWKPDATCPACGTRGTLRIRLADHLGVCTADDRGDGRPCGAVWDEATIGILAGHIRSETAVVRRRDQQGPCWCPYPGPVVVDLAVLCPRCGSARCARALERRTVSAATATLNEQRPAAG